MDIQAIASNRADATFEFMGEPMTVTFRVDRLTHEFKAEALRLNREMKKLERRQVALLEQATAVIAEDGTVEAQLEDERAEAAIQQLVEQDDKLKREVDKLVQLIVIEWDLTDNGRMIPLSPEALFRVPAVFEGAVLSAIMAQGNVGEASGARPLTNSPLPLKRKGKQATSRRHQNGTPTFRPAAIAQQ